MNTVQLVFIIGVLTGLFIGVLVGQFVIINLRKRTK